MLRLASIHSPYNSNLALAPIVTTNTFTWIGTTSCIKGNGTSSYATLTNSSFAVGTGDFTLECYYYHVSNATQQFIFNTGLQSSANGMFLGISGTNLPIFGSHGGGTIAHTTALANNTWYHLCGTRSGGVSSLYINGVLIGSSTSISFNATQTAAVIGKIFIASSLSFMNGYIYQLRFTTQCIYPTRGFSTPTSALTNITNCILLAQVVSTAIVDNRTGGATITNTGLTIAHP
jgi:hypothetical protein